MPSSPESDQLSLDELDPEELEAMLDDLRAERARRVAAGMGCYSGDVWVVCAIYPTVTVRPDPRFL